MKNSCLSLLFVAQLLGTVFYTTKYIAAGEEICPRENCLAADKCDSDYVGAPCVQPNTVCCGLVKREHRTHCRHFGGECLDNCAQALQNLAVDCPASQVCCTLV